MRVGEETWEVVDGKRAIAGELGRSERTSACQRCCRSSEAEEDSRIRIGLTMARSVATSSCTRSVSVMIRLYVSWAS